MVGRKKAKKVIRKRGRERGKENTTRKRKRLLARKEPEERTYTGFIAT